MANAFPYIREHHQRAMERVVRRFRDDDRFSALILGGSVPRGQAVETSDIDILLVATDEEYARRQESRDFSYFDTEDCDYPGGYVDGKILDMSFLREVADHGSEPARSAFSGVMVAFSRLPDLDELIRSIPVYPEAERAEKIQAFYSQAQLMMRYFIPQAEQRQDAYLMTQSAATLCLYAARLVLAENRVLFPSQKRLLETVETIPDLPERFMERISTLLRNPSTASARALTDSLEAYHDWGITFRQALARYTQDSEWRWRTGRPDLADW